MAITNLKNERSFCNVVWSSCFSTVFSGHLSKAAKRLQVLTLYCMQSTKLCVLPDYLINPHRKSVKQGVTLASS